MFSCDRIAVIRLIERLDINLNPFRNFVRHGVSLYKNTEKAQCEYLCPQTLLLIVSGRVFHQKMDGEGAATILEQFFLKYRGPF
jgi:hypothetical protein